MSYASIPAAAFATALIALSACDIVTDRSDYRVEAYEGTELSAEDVHEPWSVKIDGAEVTLTMRPPHPEAAVALVATLTDRSGRLPVLDDVWFGPYGGGIGSPVRKATVRIDTWDLDRAIRGVMDAEHPAGWRIKSVFWLGLEEEGS